MEMKLLAKMLKDKNLNKNLLMWGRINLSNLKR